MVNSSKIKARIIEKGYTQSSFAALLGISSAVLSQKINNVRDFKLQEAEKICPLLDIPDSEFSSYFFCKKNCV